MIRLKDNRYPKEIYSGITDNPDSWRMCCSKEMARRCAEDNYKLSQREKHKEIIWFKKVIILSIGVMALLGYLDILM